MKKKICISLILAVVLATSVCFVACDKTAPKGEVVEKTSIVYLGDSIAEALIGPSPVSERDNYGYYALVGKCNNFAYYNHSVSGHKTSTGMTGGDGLLEVLLRDTEDANLLLTHLKEADIIHISVLGNNVLQYDLGLLMLEVADPEFPQKYEEGTTLLNALHDGGVMTRDAIKKSAIAAGETTVEFNFPETYNNICDIVARLRELNADAKIVFQKVYNPVYEGTTLLYSEAKAKLAEITDDGRFGAQGEKITTFAQMRLVAQAILDKLNGMLDEYLEEHPDAFYILDVNKEFDDVTKLDAKDGKPNLSNDGLGAQLLFTDWTHPSNFGHAMVFNATQKLFETLGIAGPNVLDEYKKIRLEQLQRMFAPIEGFDVQDAKDAVNGADDIYGVTRAYFDAIDGYTPVNY